MIWWMSNCGNSPSGGAGCSDTLEGIGDGYFGSLYILHGNVVLQSPSNFRAL